MDPRERLKSLENLGCNIIRHKCRPSEYPDNPEGVIIAKNLRGEDLTEKLAAIIK